MAHGTLHKDLDVDREYRLLQERLDRNVTGAPDSAAMRRVLRLLFTPEEAHVARSLPQLIAVPKLAEKLDVDVDSLDELVTSMAERGLILDFERNGTRYAMAAPVVIGFFEYTFMRERPDAPMEEYAAAFEDLFEDEDFVRSVFAGSEFRVAKPEQRHNIVWPDCQRGVPRYCCFRRSARLFKIRNGPEVAMALDAGRHFVGP